jgi:hypothetical protein
MATLYGMMFICYLARVQVLSYQAILHNIESNSDYDKLMQGCFENYLKITFQDPSFVKVSVAYEMKRPSFFF